jgi:hypothetical protein
VTRLAGRHGPKHLTTCRTEREHDNVADLAGCQPVSRGNQGAISFGRAETGSTGDLPGKSALFPRPASAISSTTAEVNPVSFETQPVLGNGHFVRTPLYGNPGTSDASWDDGATWDGDPAFLRLSAPFMAESHIWQSLNYGRTSYMAEPQLWQNLIYGRASLMAGPHPLHHLSRGLM